MWPWKKFWNTDIIGKIYILIFLFIVVVTIMCLITRTKNEKQQQTSNSNIINNDISENIVMIDNSKIADEQNQMPDEILETEEVIEEKIKENTKENVSSNKKETSNNIPKAEIKETKIQQQVSIKEELKIQEDIQEKEEKQEIIETKEESRTPVIVEEYKENTNMINTMKKFITNNPSEDMLTYGFEIVVDKSITEYTNQFTYTEKRLKDMLTHRCGIIKIYAMDYYYNGNLVMTECFIL